MHWASPSASNNVEVFSDILQIDHLNESEVEYKPMSPSLIYVYIVTRPKIHTAGLLNSGIPDKAASRKSVNDTLVLCSLSDYYLISNVKTAVPAVWQRLH